jgi:hypothetical protein
MRGFLCAMKIVPHPELVEGCTLVMQAILDVLSSRDIAVCALAGVRLTVVPRMPRADRIAACS